MASGQAFEIRHPEMILVGRSSVRVYAATATNKMKNALCLADAAEDF
jgi:hypothetical protein